MGVPPHSHVRKFMCATVHMCNSSYVQQFMCAMYVWRIHVYDNLCVRRKIGLDNGTFRVYIRMYYICTHVHM